MSMRFETEYNSRAVTISFVAELLEVYSYAFFFTYPLLQLASESKDLYYAVISLVGFFGGFTTLLYIQQAIMELRDLRHQSTIRSKLRRTIDYFMMTYFGILILLLITVLCWDIVTLAKDGTSQQATKIMRGEIEHYSQEIDRLGRVAVEMLVSFVLILGDIFLLKRFVFKLNILIRRQHLVKLSFFVATHVRPFGGHNDIRFDVAQPLMSNDSEYESRGQPRLLDVLRLLVYASAYQMEMLSLAAFSLSCATVTMYVDGLAKAVNFAAIFPGVIFFLLSVSYLVLMFQELGKITDQFRHKTSVRRRMTGTHKSTLCTFRRWTLAVIIFGLAYGYLSILMSVGSIVRFLVEKTKNDTLILVFTFSIVVNYLLVKYLHNRFHALKHAPYAGTSMFILEPAKIPFLDTEDLNVFATKRGKKISFFSAVESVDLSSSGEFQ